MSAVTGAGSVGASDGSGAVAAAPPPAAPPPPPTRAHQALPRRVVTGGPGRALAPAPQLQKELVRLGFSLRESRCSVSVPLHENEVGPGASVGHGGVVLSELEKHLTGLFWPVGEHRSLLRLHFYEYLALLHVNCIPSRVNRRDVMQG